MNLYELTDIMLRKQAAMERARNTVLQPEDDDDPEWLAYCERMSAEAEKRPAPHAHTCRCMSCSGVEYEVYPYPEEN